MRVFFNGSFKRKTTAMDASCDHVANTIFNTTVSSLIQRLKAGKLNCVAQRKTLKYTTSKDSKT